MRHLSIEEVNFSRLLKKTEKNLLGYIEGSSFSPPEDRLFGNKSVLEGCMKVSPCQGFEPFLRKLAEQWNQLAAIDSLTDSKKLQRLHGGPPPSQLSLAAYKNKLDHLQQLYKSILEREKVLLTTDDDLESTVSSDSFTDLPDDSSMSNILLSERNELLSTDDVEQDDSKSIEELLKLHRETQEQLTSDILLMVSALKETSMQSLNIVTEDNSRLDTVGQEVSKSLEMVSIYSLFEH